MAPPRVPEISPPSDQDCQTLRNAFQGIGTDEKAIIEILGHRNARQRRKIKQTYQQLHNESLIDRLHSELSGDFRKAIIWWTYDPPERDARLANEALKKNKNGGTEHLQVIVEIACATSPDHLVSVRRAYSSLFCCSLEEDIASNVSPPLRKLLVALVSSYRHDKVRADMDVANSEAEKLREAIVAQVLDSSNDTTVCILCTRNVHQLRATFRGYEQQFGKPIYQHIEAYKKDNWGCLLRMVIQCLDSPEHHFAKVIGDSIRGIGTDEDSLTRVVVTRADTDMKMIREAFFYMYHIKLKDAILGDVSGDYRDFLMTLLDLAT